MLDLSEEIKDLDSSRYLFLSFLVTIEPGGVSTLHDHVNRPEHTYIISGTLTDYPKDGDAKEYGPGSNLVVPSDTVHWFANRGKEPVVLIATFPYKSAR